MDAAEPAFEAAVNVADQELGQGEGDQRKKEDEGHQKDEQQDIVAVEVRNAEVVPFRSQQLQFASTVMLSLSWTHAIYGVEEFLDSRNDIQNPLIALLISLLKLRVPAIVVPVLFLAFSGPLSSQGTHPLRRSAYHLAVCSLLGAPYFLLPFLLPERCYSPGLSNKQHHMARRSSAYSVPGQRASALRTWLSCCGPVVLVVIICAAKLYRARKKLGPVAAPLAAPAVAPLAAPIEPPMPAPIAAPIEPPMPAPVAAPMVPEGPNELDLLALDEAELGRDRFRG
ncbi:uncharacterized protein LOC144135248 [Amblyomma americanum]